MNEPITTIPTRVIKLGGSLLSNAGTPQRILRWLENNAQQQTPKGARLWKNFWIVGGGELANTVRDWDVKFSLDPKFAHWVCIDLMDVNARLLSSWFSHWPVSDQFTCPPESMNQIVLVGSWLRQRKSELPESWATTSDSIAMAVANSLQAEELVLLKSCNPPERLSLETLASSDFVDQHFVPQFRSLPRTLNLRFVNLSSDQFGEAVLKKSLADR